MQLSVLPLHVDGAALDLPFLDALTEAEGLVIGHGDEFAEVRFGDHGDVDGDGFALFGSTRRGAAR